MIITIMIKTRPGAHAVALQAEVLPGQGGRSGPSGLAAGGRDYAIL